MSGRLHESRWETVPRLSDTLMTGESFPEDGMLETRDVGKWPAAGASVLVILGAL